VGCAMPCRLLHVDITWPPNMLLAVDRSPCMHGAQKVENVGCAGHHMCRADAAHTVPQQTCRHTGLAAPSQLAGTRSCAQSINAAHYTPCHNCQHSQITALCEQSSHLGLGRTLGRMRWQEVWRRMRSRHTHPFSLLSRFFGTHSTHGSFIHAFDDLDDYVVICSICQRCRQHAKQLPAYSDQNHHTSNNNTSPPE
jgi:hypothetical protein